MKRHRIQRPVPKVLVLTGVTWLALGAYFVLAGYPDAVAPDRTLDTFIWSALGVIGLAGGVGLIGGRPFARGTIVFLAGLGLAASVSFLIGVPYPRVSFWWVVLAMALFFAWSTFLVVWLWHTYEVASETAG